MSPLPIQKRKQPSRRLRSFHSRRAHSCISVRSQLSVVALCCDPAQAGSGLLFELIKKCLPLQRSLACPAEQPIHTAHLYFPTFSGRKGGSWGTKGCASDPAPGVDSTLSSEVAGGVIFCSDLSPFPQAFSPQSIFLPIFLPSVSVFLVLALLPLCLSLFCCLCHQHLNPVCPSRSHLRAGM